MSGRLVSAVFDSSLPAWLKPYAAAAASFAADDGSRVYPSIKRIARMVGRCERATQTAVHELRRRGVLVVEVDHARYRATRYRFNTAALPQLRDAAQLDLFPQPRDVDSRPTCSRGSFPQSCTGINRQWTAPHGCSGLHPIRQGSVSSYYSSNARARKRPRQTPESEGLMTTAPAIVAPIAFEVDGPPAVKGSTFSFFYRGRIVTKQDAKNLTAWAAQVAWCAREAGVPLIPKGVGVVVSVTYEFAPPIRVVRSCPCTRPDIDKLARALLDALTGVAYEDDGQVVSLTVRKVYGLDTRTRVWVARA